MKDVLEVTFQGWTATPRMPFVLSGNAVCMNVPSYSSILGILGCCLGRLVIPGEASVGVYYEYDALNRDIESRYRFEFDGEYLKPNVKGRDVYSWEYHSNPKLILWIDRPDWSEFFINPAGTPVLGRSQDVLKIISSKIVAVSPVEAGTVSGCMVPFRPENAVAGQLVQLTDAFIESEQIGGGRTPANPCVYMAIPYDTPGRVVLPDLYMTNTDRCIYMHKWI